MKILGCSDLHRDLAATQLIIDASPQADVVIVAGDLATKGVGAHDVLAILARSAAPVLIIHGNHDNTDALSRYCSSTPNLHYLHASAAQLAGQEFFGLGGEIPSRNAAIWNQSETEEAAGKLLKACPKGAILITHTPPQGITDVQRDGTHEGSIAIAAAAKNLQPPLLLCGHIHNAWGMSGKIDATRVHNLGPTANWFEI